MNHQQSTRLFLVSLGAVVALFISAVVVMWRAGLLTFSGTDPSSKVVAAALALVGSFVAALVTIVGIVLRHAVDLESARHHHRESERNAILDTDTARRLKLEAAVKALQLFATPSGTPSPAIQRDGALFMLADLRQHQLVLQLLDDLLSQSDSIAPGTAARLLDHALLHGTTDEKNQAISILDDHAAKMIGPTGFALPSTLLDWHDGLPEYVREWTPAVFGKVLMARSLDEWVSVHPYRANGIIAALSLGWLRESTSRLKDDQGAVLREILAAFPNCRQVYHPTRVIDVEQLRVAVASCTVQTGLADGICRQLAMWRSMSDSDA